MSDNNICFEFLLLTADDPPPLDYDDDYAMEDKKEIETTWMDDSICQENLMDIVVLSPEETTTDSSNHIRSTNHFKLFFEELGYLTEEPEPIDPTIDYEVEYNERLKLQKSLYKGKRRQHHIHLSGGGNNSNTPSLLLDDTNTTILSSGVSSTSSSIIMHYDHHHHHYHHQQHRHHHQHHPNDSRSSLYLDHSSPSNHHHTLSHSNHHHHHHVPYNCNNVTLEKHHRLRHVH